MQIQPPWAFCFHPPSRCRSATASRNLSASFRDTRKWLCNCSSIHIFYCISFPPPFPPPLLAVLSIELFILAFSSWNTKNQYRTWRSIAFLNSVQRVYSYLKELEKYASLLLFSLITRFNRFIFIENEENRYSIFLIMEGPDL